MHNWYLYQKLIDQLYPETRHLEYNALLKGSILHELIDYHNPYDILLKYLNPSLNNHDKSLVYGLFIGALFDNFNIDTISITKDLHPVLKNPESEFIPELKDEVIQHIFDNYNGQTLDGDIIEASDQIYTLLSPWLINHDYSTLLIDLDNTIFDFDLGEYISFVNVIKKHHLEYSDTFFETYKRINKELWKQIEEGLITKDELTRLRFTLTFKELGMPMDIGPLCGEEYKEELSFRSDYIDGAKEAMNILHKHYKIAIITNGVKTTQLSRIARSDLASYYDKLFISEEIGFEKPSVNYFEYVLKHIDENKKDKILIIGDSISSDIKGAFNAGIDALWINPQLKKADYPVIASLPSIKYLYLFLNH